MQLCTDSAPNSNLLAGFRKPWKGCCYEEGINGKRLLIIGESHYGKAEGLDEEFTRKLILKVARGEERLRFFTNVANLFGLRPEDFYPKISFYNYIQKMMNKPRQRVSAADRGAPADQHLFFKVLRDLRPQRILVLGKTNWRYLPSAHPATEWSICTKEPNLHLNFRKVTGGGSQECDQYAYWYPTWRSEFALAGAILHPSAPGFSVDDWAKWIGTFMDFSVKPSKDSIT